MGWAPSAVAAQVIADDLGISTENTAKWWRAHETIGATFHAGQPVIVDEASLAGILSLDRITGLAENATAKVLLVGDCGQFQSVDAGGSFQPPHPRPRRRRPRTGGCSPLHHEWEKTAFLALRHGHSDVIDTYLNHHRIHGGGAEGNGRRGVGGVASRSPV